MNGINFDAYVLCSLLSNENIYAETNSRSGRIALKIESRQTEQILVGPTILNYLIDNEKSKRFRFKNNFKRVFTFRLDRSNSILDISSNRPSIENPRNSIITIARKRL